MIRGKSRRRVSFTGVIAGTCCSKLDYSVRLACAEVDQVVLNRLRSVANKQEIRQDKCPT